MKKILPLAVVLYLASAGVSFGALQLTNTTQPAPVSPIVEEEQDPQALAIDPGEPRDQVCPLNGAMYTMTEKNVWTTRRPLAVMIENHPEARPQSGLIKADIVFEALAEGGVTRFMAMYLCDATRKDVVLAPIRSARTYYIDWASGFNKPLYVNVGGANLPGATDALGQLSQYGWAGQNNINQFSVGYPTFKRDYNRIKGKDIATEHTMVSSTELLWEYAKTARKWTNTDPKGNDWYEGFTGWTFAESEEAAGDVKTFSYAFWDGFGDYAVRWDYDAAGKVYKRTMAGQPHVDLETGDQIAVRTVIALFSKEKAAVNELKHMLYQTTGTGTAMMFTNGTATEVNWSKPKRESELVFTDKKGKPISMNPGKVWISVMDVGTEIEY